MMDFITAMYPHWWVYLLDALKGYVILSITIPVLDWMADGRKPIQRRIK